MPNNGRRFGADYVTITGTNLGNGTDITSVIIRNSPATITSQGTDYVIAVTTMGSVGRGNVQVESTSFGISTLTNGYVYNPSMNPACHTECPNIPRWCSVYCHSINWSFCW